MFKKIGVQRPKSENLTSPSANAKSKVLHLFNMV